MSNRFDVIVIGGGHAGCEAAMAAAKMGSSVLLLTPDLNGLAKMSCNPAVGGIAKGQIVREIDALGGYSALVTDAATLQFRMLNRSKGPAMWSPRSQCDRMAYSREWRRILENTPNLHIWQDQVDSLIPIRTHGGACSVVSSSLLLREGSGCCLVRYFGHDTQYTIPAPVTVIRTGAFHRTDLRAIRFPASVRQVEPSAFTGNSKLERFDFDLGGPAAAMAPGSSVQDGSKTAAPCLHGAADEAAPRSATVLFPDVVFRKDDIEALFLPQAEELVCLGQKLAFEPDPDTLFQFRAYDCLFETYAGAMEQASIAISRLAWPIDLSSARRDFYRSWLAANLPDLLAEMTRKDDPGILRQVLSLHILNQSQVLDAIAFCEEHRRPACLQLLLSFHHQEFGEEDFDYSL